MSKEQDSYMVVAGKLFFIDLFYVLPIWTFFVMLYYNCVFLKRGFDQQNYIFNFH